MTIFLQAIMLALVLNLLVHLARLTRVPSLGNRMLVVMLFNSTTVAVLIVLAEYMQMHALRVVGLIFVLLSATTSLAFVAFKKKSNQIRRGGP